jgi:hypothetical protein
MRTSREMDMRDMMQKTIDTLAAENERLQARVVELESALRGYVKATTGQESATVTFPMALEGDQ